jgi:aryl-alcohol dehydrogenase-like predicted oxidoreductase
VNYFDTAEMYGFGNAEILMGRALKKAGWARKDYVLSTKYIVAGKGVNDTFLSRKHIMEGVDASLKRLQLDYMDIAFAHRYDYETPMEEVCRAFNNIIEQGKAFYWATSEWSAEQIMEAHECCERLDLIKPIADQPEYNLFIRHKVESDYVPLYEKWGCGLTTWSPLAGGLLAGKYNDGRDPEDSRYHGEKLTSKSDCDRNR